MQLILLRTHGSFSFIVTNYIDTPPALNFLCASHRRVDGLYRVMPERWHFSISESWRLEMPHKIAINDTTYNNASDQERRQVHQLLSGLKIIGQADMVVPDASVKLVICPDAKDVCDPPPLQTFGFPGSIVDGIRDGINDVANALGLCNTACDLAASTALAACAANTAGAGYVFCVAVTEAARQECKKRC